MKNKSVLKYFSIIILFILFYSIGYLTDEYKFFPWKYLDKINANAISTINKFSSSTNVDKTSISTTFIKLNVVKKEVPVSKNGFGGGLTSFGDELLLVTHEGNIMLISEHEIIQTKIIAPDNGLEKYITVAKSSKYNNFSHRFDFVRYNDILFYTAVNYQCLLLSYSEWMSDGECFCNTIAKLVLPNGINSIMDFQAKRDDWEIIYRSQPCLKLKSEGLAIDGRLAGGRMAYYKPNKIVLGNGDYEFNGVQNLISYPQLKSNDYGKVIEIDLINGKYRIISIGHRNIQGILFDSGGQLWVCEHGPRGGDELNLIVEGKNYGWPDVTLGTKYDKLPWPVKGEYGRHDLHTSPTYAWVPSVAISNIIEIENFHPSWDGDILASSLAGRTLYRLRVKDNKVIFVEPIKIGERIRYAHQHVDGRIILWTDKHNIWFISSTENNYAKERIDKLITISDYNDQQKKAIKLAFDMCIMCHSFESNHHQLAPALNSIYNSRIGGTGFSHYSEALKSKLGRWTNAKLVMFLQDPQSLVPGTSMPNPRIKDKQVIDAIIEILKKLKSED